MSLTAAHATSLTWDGNGATAPNPDGGAGTWDVNTTANWWDGVSANVVWPALGGSDDDAIFANTAGTVSLAAGGVTANDLTFSTTGYLIQSNTLTLNGSTPTITTDPGVSATISSTIAGAAGLVKTGAGTLTLSVANNYTGGTTINGGTICPNNNAAFGTGTLTLSGCTLVPTSGAVNYIYTNPIVVTAATTNTITGYNGGSNIPRLRGAITGSGTLRLNNTVGGYGNFEIGGDLSGFTGTLWIDNTGNYMNGGVGSATIAGANNGSQAHFVTSGLTSGGGGFWISPGDNATFQMGDLAGTGGLITGGGASNVTLEIGALNTDTTYAGSIENSNPLKLTKVGSGTLTLTGANTYAGITTINAGTLELVKATTLGTSGIAMGAANSPTLKLSSLLAGDSWTFAKPISGGSANAKIEMAGLGTVILTPGSGSSFTGSSTGALTVTGGKLYLNGAFDTAPAVSVAGGALFGGTSTAGAVTLADTAILEGGASGSGVLTLGSVSFAGSGTVRGVPSATAAPIVVTNALTTAGGADSITVELVSAPTVNGTYHLIQFGSHAGAIGDFKFPSLARSLSLQQNGNFIDVAVNSANYPVWTGTKSSEWSTNPIGSPENWKLSSDSSPTDFLNLDSVVFPSLASSYDIDVSATDVAPVAMTFNNDSPNDYTLGGSMDITGGSLIKNGSGMLTISGVYTTSGGYSFPGGATLNNGSVVIDTETALGTGTRTFNGGTLQYAGSISETWSRATLVDVGGGTLDIVNGATNLTHTGAISGSGVLTKTGAGKLSLPNASSHTGGMTITGGTVCPNNNTALGTGTLTLSGGTLYPTTTGDYTYTNPIVVTAATTNTIAGFGGGGNRIPRLRGAITGSGTLYFKNTVGDFGNFEVGGDLSGFTGTLWIDNAGNYMNGGIGSATIAGANDGSQAHFVTSGATTGGGGLWISPGANGTFQMGDLAGTGGRIAGGGASNVTLEIGALNTDTTYAGRIENDGPAPKLTKVGSGSLTLTGSNTYGGITTITQGTLAVSNTTGSGTGSGAVTVQTTATLAGTGSISGNVSVEAGGFVAPGEAGIGTLTVGSAALSGTYQCQLDVASGDQVVVSGALTVNSGAAIVVSTLGSPAAASYIIATYGSLGGGAPTVTGIPSGYVLDTATAGQIKLVKSGGGFSDWADSWLGLTDKTPAGDPDGDGISNVMEYVIGGDPRVSSTSYLPGEAIDGTDLVLSYERSDASEADTTQTGQWSTNLTDWNDLAPVLVNENAADPDSMEIRIPLTNAVGGKLFGRLNVIKP
jgi:autotransporter-associated beta strand protein